MKFNKEIDQYLNDKKFDNGIDVLISDSQTDIKSRNDFIVEITKKKKRITCKTSIISVSKNCNVKKKTKKVS